jgi:hypothetical protein
MYDYDNQPDIMYDGELTILKTTTHGIRYSWLETHGIANTNDSVETEDPDGDGYNDLQEYFQGTDPKNANSHPTVNFTVNGGQLVMSVPTIPAGTNAWIHSGGTTRWYWDMYLIKGSRNFHSTNQPYDQIWPCYADAGYSGLTRYYDLEMRTNLASSSWQGIPGYTNLAYITTSTPYYHNAQPSVLDAAANQHLYDPIVYTNTVLLDPGYFRVTVRLTPRVWIPNCGW